MSLYSELSSVINEIDEFSSLLVHIEGTSEDEDPSVGITVVDGVQTQFHTSASGVMEVLVDLGISSKDPSTARSLAYTAARALVEFSDRHNELMTISLRGPVKLARRYIGGESLYVVPLRVLKRNV